MLETGNLMKEEAWSILMYLVIIEQGVEGKHCQKQSFSSPIINNYDQDCCSKNYYHLFNIHYIRGFSKVPLMDPKSLVYTWTVEFSVKSNVMHLITFDGVKVLIVGGVVPIKYFT